MRWSICHPIAATSSIPNIGAANVTAKIKSETPIKAHERGAGALLARARVVL